MPPLRTFDLQRGSRRGLTACFAFDRYAQRLGTLSGGIRGCLPTGTVHIDGAR